MRYPPSQLTLSVILSTRVLRIVRTAGIEATAFGKNSSIRISLDSGSIKR